MDNDEQKMSCTTRSWVVAGLAGLIAMVLLMSSGGWSFFPALLAGIILAVVAGLLITRFWCQQPSMSDTSAASSAPTPIAASTAPLAAASGVAAATASKPAAEAPAPSAPAKAVAAKPVKKPVAKKPAVKKTAAEKAPAKTATKAPVKTATKAPVKTATKAPAKTVAKTAAAPAAVKKPVAKKPAAKTAKPAVKPVAADGKPALLTAARAGGADDLKLISGVGPKLETTLNELGFYHFDQVAGWRKKEIEWVDSRLKFKGRIERDDWMAQAKTLAKGGAAKVPTAKAKK